MIKIESVDRYFIDTCNVCGSKLNVKLLKFEQDNNANNISVCLCENCMQNLLSQLKIYTNLDVFMYKGKKFKTIISPYGESCFGCYFNDKDCYDVSELPDCADSSRIFIDESKE